ncbi:hypothetical protein PROFUN_04589 [Planoprotostelium fungivorum]|uniref:Uncharacterized protein n=1 Tax=Planoprotostelium fungivorum TaxID=1890364 RepID=A0A2P6NUB9_9EUKA|nr:hypothetical protein PROFUN_04589 [Planoprotostelium fungivorum]
MKWFVRFRLNISDSSDRSRLPTDGVDEGPTVAEDIPDHLDDTIGRDAGQCLIPFPRLTCQSHKLIYQTASSESVHWERIFVLNCTFFWSHVSEVVITSSLLSDSKAEIAGSLSYISVNDTHMSNSWFFTTASNNSYISFAHNAIAGSAITFTCKQLGESHHIASHNQIETSSITFDSQGQMRSIQFNDNHGLEDGYLYAEYQYTEYKSSSVLFTVEDNTLRELVTSVISMIRTSMLMQNNTIGRVVLALQRNFGHFDLHVVENLLEDLSISSRSLYTIQIDRLTSRNASLSLDKAILTINSSSVHSMSVQRVGCMYPTQDILHDNDMTHVTHLSCMHGASIHIFRNRFFSYHLSSIHDSFPLFVRDPDRILIRENSWKGSVGPALWIDRYLESIIEISSSDIMDYGYVTGVGAAISLSDIVGSKIVISDVNVTNCRANTGGGIGIVARNSEISMRNVRMINNSATLDGGAASMWGSSNVVLSIRNCTFLENIASHGSTLSVMEFERFEMSGNVIYASPLDMDTDHTVVFAGNSISHDNDIHCPPLTVLSEVQNGGYSWSCSPCEDGRYVSGTSELIRGNIFNDTCQICPPNTVCRRGVIPRAKAGFWCEEDPNGHLYCIDCPSGYCKSVEHPWDNSCESHHRGILCGDCEDGYTIGFLSSRCQSMEQCSNWYGLVVFLLPCLYVTALLFLPIGDGSVWKTLSFFLQTAPLLVSRRYFDGIMGLFALTISPKNGESTGNLGFCLGKLDYVQREFIVLYAPVVTVMALGMGWFLNDVFLRQESRTFVPGGSRSWASRFSTGITTACLLVYGGVLSICLKLSFCIQVGDHGSVMYNSGSMSCHSAWRPILLTIYMVILLPSPFAKIETEDDTNINGRTHGFRRLLQRRLQVSGLLPFECSPLYRYWETVYMLRRLAVAVIYVLTVNTIWNQTALRLLTLLSFGSHALVQPFKTRPGHVLETACLLSLACMSAISNFEDKSYYIIAEVNCKEEEELKGGQIVLVVMPLVVGFIFATRKMWKKISKIFQKKEVSERLLVNGEDE